MTAPRTEAGLALLRTLYPETRTFDEHPGTEVRMPGFRWDEYDRDRAAVLDIEAEAARIDPLRAAVRDWIDFGAGDGSGQATADERRLLETIAAAYEAEP